MATPSTSSRMDGLTKAYPAGKKVFENIRLSLRYPGEDHGVVGSNGSGKSSLPCAPWPAGPGFQGKA